MPQGSCTWQHVAAVTLLANGLAGCGQAGANVPTLAVRPATRAAGTRPLSLAPATKVMAPTRPTEAIPAQPEAAGGPPALPTLPVPDPAPAAEPAPALLAAPAAPNYLTGGLSGRPTLRDATATPVAAEAGGLYRDAAHGIVATIPPGALTRDAEVRFERLPAPSAEPSGDRLPLVRLAADLGGAALAPGMTITVRVSLSAAMVGEATKRRHGHSLAGRPTADGGLEIDVRIGGPDAPAGTDDMVHVASWGGPGPADDDSMGVFGCDMITPPDAPAAAAAPPAPAAAAPAAAAPAAGPAAAAPATAPAAAGAPAAPAAPSTEDDGAAAGLKPVTVAADSVLVRFRDDEVEDGDRIQVRLNGVVVPGLENHMLTARGTDMRLPFKPGVNEITVTALTVGAQGPNTVELQFEDGAVVAGEALQVSRGMAKGESETLRVTVATGR